MRTTDNNRGNCQIEDCYLNDLGIIANKSLNDLKQEFPDILIFPQNLGENKDAIEKTPLFFLQEKNLITNNIMGFVGVNDTQLAITSRFYPEGNDYFLHYMLQKVFTPNIVDLKVNMDQESIWDLFLIYLFPFYLKKALNQGLFKEYQRREYNDTHLKGPIDIPRHIRLNNPFLGKIAYKTREHSFDNRITQLIRHTIEYIKGHSIASQVVNSNLEIRDYVNQVVFATTSYNKNDRRTIIRKNLSRVNHPFYIEYEILRRICLQILHKKGLTIGKEKDKVYGLLFDGAWLWEEYLNTILAPLKFVHPENKTGKNPIFLFKGPKYPRFPDFYHSDKEIVLDAKYKHLEHSGELDRDDINQIISYMYVLQSKKGGFIFPYSMNKIIPIGALNGYNGEVTRLGMGIPINKLNFRNFVDEMKKNEEEFISPTFLTID